jgi:phage tail-like protein
MTIYESTQFTPHPVQVGGALAVLGSYEAGSWAVVWDEDHEEVSQSVGLLDFGLVGLVRLHVTTIGRSAPAVSGGTWWAEVLLDGEVLHSWEIEADTTRVRTDVAIPTADAKYAYTIAVRLRFNGTADTEYHAELPAVIVSNLSEDTSKGSALLINRSPEPSETGISISGPITFQIVAQPVDVLGLGEGPLAYYDALNLHVSTKESAPMDVESIHDLSGNGEHLQQGTAAQEANVSQIASTQRDRALDFDGGDDYPSAGGALTAAGDEWTVGIYPEPDRTTTLSEALLEIADGANTLAFAQCTTTSGKMGFYDIGGAWVDTGNNSTSSSSYIWTLDDATSTGTLYKSGASYATGTFNATAITNGRVYMPTSGAFTKFDGRIRRAAIFGTVLGSSDIARLNAWLRDIDGRVGTGSVYVNDDLIATFDGDSVIFFLSWTGSTSTDSTGRIITYSLTPPAALDDDTEYTVRVVHDGIDGLAPDGAFDYSYTFTTEDLTGPTLTAEGIDLGVVRVTYDEAMAAVSASAVGDALNPASYTLTLSADTERLPAVRGQDVVISSVVAVGDSVFDLVLDMELTPTALYTIASTATDVYGNASTDSADFEGYLPFVDERRRFNLLDMVPDTNLAQDSTGELQNLLLSFQELYELMLYMADKWGEILDPDLAPEVFVDAMLYDLGYPFDFDLSLADKRRLVKVLRAMYKQKGTDIGIINAIRLFLGIEATITTPYKSNAYLGSTYLSKTGTAAPIAPMYLGTAVVANLYTFVVNVPETLTAEEEARMDAIIDFMKRAPCHWRIEAPSTVTAPDHWALGYSRLGVSTIIHS